jgi:hypothetical protein
MHFPLSLQLLGHEFVKLVEGLEQSSLVYPALQMHSPAGEHWPFLEQSFLHLTVTAGTPPTAVDCPVPEQSGPDEPVRHSQT